MAALPIIYKRNQGQTTRSLTAIGLALILGSLCYWLHTQLVLRLPTDQQTTMAVRNAVDLYRLAEPYPNSKNPLYAQGTLVTAAMVDQMEKDSGKGTTVNIKVTAASPVSYAIHIQYGVPSLLFMIGAYFIFVLVNKDRFADFLIATESEMKKVSWSSRAELVGLTIVVIVTVILLAIIIWLADTGVIWGMRALKVY